jgi:methylenetetrahydrofolate reductase (NADPH)
MSPAPKAQAGVPAPAPSVMDGWSLEATLPKPEEIEALTGLLMPGAEVFLSTLPHVSLDRQIETARLVRAAGLEPVPHLAARYFAATRDLADFLERVVGEAAVRRLLVIGGDLDPPRGCFASSLDVIASGLLGAFGIERVGIAGYPDGHPKITDAALATALDSKLDALGAAGFDVEIVTQFCFHAAPIRAWIARFHARRPRIPVRVGLAGPASLKALVRYALRCGVGMPLDGVGQKVAMASQLIRSVSPRAIVQALDGDGVAGAGGRVSAHFFSFGGLERTARWAADAAQGRYQ